MLQEINVFYVLEDSTVGQKKFPSKRISLLLRFFVVIAPRERTEK